MAGLKSELGDRQAGGEARTHVAPAQTAKHSADSGEGPVWHPGIQGFHMDPAGRRSTGKTPQSRVPGSNKCTSSGMARATTGRPPTGHRHSFRPRPGRPAAGRPTGREQADFSSGEPLPGAGSGSRKQASRESTVLPGHSESPAPCVLASGSRDDESHSGPATAPLRHTRTKQRQHGHEDVKVTSAKQSHYETRYRVMSSMFPQQ